MPKGVYLRTKEYREIMSKTIKGRKLPEEWKRKISEGNKGKKKSKTAEHIKKIVISRKKNGWFKNPETFRQKISKAHKGKKMSLEFCKKTSERMMGEQNPAKRLDVRKKISESKKGKSLSEKQRASIKNIFPIMWKRINAEIPILEQQGFRCIPIGKVIPDIIAIKDGKVYAVEVEYGIPNYKKYDDETRKYFDDIIWLLRKASNSKHNFYNIDIKLEKNKPT